MIIMLYIAFFIAFLFIAFCLYRNNWVYRQRTLIIHNDFKSYQKLESYDEMYRKFWIWDIKKFIKE